MFNVIKNKDMWNEATCEVDRRHSETAGGILW